MPANMSQPPFVLDAAGLPLVLYHGGLIWQEPDMTAMHAGALWLTPDVTVAAGYADQYPAADGREIKVYHVAMKNPLDLRDRSVWPVVFPEPELVTDSLIAKNRGTVEHAVAFARQFGHDGVIHPDSDVCNRFVMGAPSYVVFDASQLVLARPTGEEDQYDLRGIRVRGEGTSLVANAYAVGRLYDTVFESVRGLQSFDLIVMVPPGGGGTEGAVAWSEQAQFDGTPGSHSDDQTDLDKFLAAKKASIALNFLGPNPEPGTYCVAPPEAGWTSNWKANGEAVLVVRQPDVDRYERARPERPTPRP